MKALWISLVAVCIAFPTFAKNEKTNYCSPITLKDQVALTDILSSPKDNVKKEILTSGTVKKVCEKKGCWLRLQAGEKEVRVTFKDYGFFVPPTLLDQQILVQGELIEKKMSVKDQKHFLKDEGAPKEVINAVKTEKLEFEFVAAGVQIVNK
jgi:hypothetical protein